MEEKEKKIIKKKRLDKSKIAMKIIAIILVLAFLIPMIASTVFYFIGE